MELSLQLHEILLFTFVPIILYLCIVRSYGYKAGRRMPPELKGAWPLIGHLRLLGKQIPLHRLFGGMSDEYGNIFGIRLGTRRAIVISSKELTRECFTITDKAFSSRPRPLPIKHIGYDDYMFGFATYGPYWRELRKIVMTQLLSVTRLELRKHIREIEINNLLEGLHLTCKENGGSAVVEMKERFGDLAVNIMLRSVAGQRYDRADPESARCRKAFHEFDHLLGIQYYSDALPALGWIDFLNGSVGMLKKAHREIDHYLSMWISEHRQKKVSEEIEERNKDFIDVMLSALDDGRPVQELERIIKGTTVSLLGAGTDTSAITLTWAVSLLLNNPDSLRKAQEELEITIGTSRQVEEKDIKDLPYLQAIVKETLRLYPPAPLSAPRESMEDCKLAGYDIPKGTQLFVNLWKLHRDPSVWKNPGDFIPERFLEENRDLDFKGQDFEYLPFGSGRRMCPGLALGKQVVQLALARLLHGFELSSPSGKQVDMTEGEGMTLPKETPLEALVIPKSSARLYVC